MSILKDKLEKAGLRSSRPHQPRSKGKKGYYGFDDKDKVWPLPKEIKGFFSSQKYFFGDHFGLNFYHYLPYKNEKFELEKDKSKLLKEIGSSLKDTRSLLTALQQRQNLILEPEKFKCWKAEFKTISRLIIGQGQQTPLEVGVTIHHTYGIPYIPGSALKGLTRHYWLDELATEYEISPLELEDLKKRGLDNPSPYERFESLVSQAAWPELINNEARRKRAKKALEAIYNELKKEKPNLPEMKEILERARLFSLAFGSQQHRGRIIFLDAFPLELRQPFELDIINCHHQDYYTSREDKPQAPAEWDQPVPVFFLVLKPGVRFKVVLSYQGCEIDNHSELLEVTQGYLKRALEEWGIGGKTMLGYGCLKCTA